MKFYNSEGNLISLESFVEMYSKAYYIGVPKIKGIKYTQTSILGIIPFRDLMVHNCERHNRL